MIKGVNIKKLYPRKLAWFWNKDTRVLLIGLYVFTIGIDFGLKDSNWARHFFRDCPVCHKSLKVQSRSQRVFFHKECRKQGRKLMRLRGK